MTLCLDRHSECTDDVHCVFATYSPLDVKADLKLNHARELCRQLQCIQEIDLAIAPPEPGFGALRDGPLHEKECLKLPPTTSLVLNGSETRRDGHSGQTMDANGKSSKRRGCKTKRLQDTNTIQHQSKPSTDIGKGNNTNARSATRSTRCISTQCKRYKCSTCGRAFHQASDLREHRRTHTGEKSLTCRDCGRGFAQTSKLSRHNKIHTGVRPYKCPVCGHGFIQKHQLTGHLGMGRRCEFLASSRGGRVD